MEELLLTTLGLPERPFCRGLALLGGEWRRPLREAKTSHLFGGRGRDTSFGQAGTDGNRSNKQVKYLDLPGMLRVGVRSFHRSHPIPHVDVMSIVRREVILRSSRHAWIDVGGGSVGQELGWISDGSLEDSHGDVDGMVEDHANTKQRRLPPHHDALYNRELLSDGYPRFP